MEEEEEEEEKEKEKIPLCESIGHRPLWGRCPAPTLNYNHDLPKQGTGTADHLTLLRLFWVWVLAGGMGCGWGLDAPAHPSATIL